jgi:hypothetical protein
MEPADPPAGWNRHPYGDGPFARLHATVTVASGLYAWQLDDLVAYLGQTRTPLAKRLGLNVYATISTYNTLARQPGRTNGVSNPTVESMPSRTLRGRRVPSSRSVSRHVGVAGIGR